MMINAAVEGTSDTGAARRVIEVAGHTLARDPHVAGGRTRLDPKISKYNEAARFGPWVVFRDSDSQCPVELRRKFAASIRDWQPSFLLRIAHSMTESWFLADTDGFADYFHIAQARVPRDPEALENGKQVLLGLCKNSSSRDIREEVVATDGGPGPLFVDHLNEFALTRWDVESACERSDSLRRAVDKIRALSGGNG